MIEVSRNTLADLEDRICQLEGDVSELIGIISHLKNFIETVLPIEYSFCRYCGYNSKIYTPHKVCAECGNEVHETSVSGKEDQ